MRHGLDIDPFKLARGFRPWSVPGTAFMFFPHVGVVPVSGAASSWATTRGGLYVTSQATPSKRPTLASGINGRPTIALAGASSQELTNTTQNIFTAGAPRYILAVAKAGNAVGGSIISFRLDTTGGRYWSCMAQVIGGQMFWFTDGVAINGNEAGAGPDMTQASIIEWELTVGSQAVVRVNGVARTVLGGLIVAEAGTTGFRIGSRAGSGFYTGDLPYIYGASPIPSAANKALLRSYYSRIAGGIGGIA